MNKYKGLNIFIISVLLILPITLNVALTWGDELWNFQSIYKMVLGNQIYTDINVIQTPLFFYIGEIIFKILGSNLFVFRIYHSIIIGILMLFTYVLLKELKIKSKFIKFFLLIILGYTIYSFAPAQANYNFLALAVYVIGTCLSIKLNNDEKKYYNIQATIALAILLTKQNIGIFYICGLIVSIFLSNKTLKTKIKRCIYLIITFMIETSIFAIILYINGNLYGFINYCFLGMKEFGTENIAFSIGEFLVAIFITLINVITSVFLLKNKKTKKMLTNTEKENIKKMLSFAILLLPNIYPIFNSIHRNIAIYLLVVNIAYLIFIIFKNFDFEDKIKKIYKVIIAIIIIIFFLWEIYLWGYWVKNVVINTNYPYTYNDLFFGAELEKETQDNMEKIIDFIKNSKANVILISPKSTLYNLPIKKNNGVYDLVLRGNLGQNGENRLIEDIQIRENTIFIIEDKNCIYQESTKIKNYIKNNLEEIGTIEEFKVYKTKK